MTLITRIIHVILLFLASGSVIGQYEGLDSNRRQSIQKQEETPFADDIVAYRYKDMAYSGMDFTVFGTGISYHLELAPYTGIHLNDKIYAAVGVIGSYYGDSYIPINTLVGGTFAFVRIPVGSIFLHGEYRYQNAINSYYRSEREWFGTPVIGGGYNSDGNLSAYALVGIAFNPKFAYTNSLGSFVYRFGFRF